MRQPIDRIRQIDLMDNVEDRVSSHFSKLLRVSVIRDSIAKTHVKREEKTSFTSEIVHHAKCG